MIPDNIQQLAEKEYPYIDDPGSECNQLTDAYRAAFIRGLTLRLQESKTRRALEYLIEVKDHKDEHGKDDWYNDNQPRAWENAREALSSPLEVVDIDKDKEIERLKQLLYNSERVWHAQFYNRSTTMTANQIDNQFAVRWKEFAERNDIHFKPLPKPPQP